MMLLFSAVALCTVTTTSAEPLHTQIDRLIQRQATGPFAAKSTDSEFLRRIYLDLAGQIPTVAETRNFLKSDHPDKRTILIDQLLEDPRYARRMAELFNVILLERRGVDETWHRFLTTSFSENVPWTVMVQRMIQPDLEDPNQQGAGFFLTKRLEKYGQNPTDYPGLASDIGRLFLGMDLACAQCHDHLFVDAYKQRDFQGLYAFVSNTFIRTDLEFPAIGQRVMKSPLEFQSVFEEVAFSTGPRIPGQTELMVPEHVAADEFAIAPNKETKAPGVPAFNPLNFLSTQLPVPENQAFNRNIVNRLWFVMMGKGLVEPLDLHHPDNPPTHPALLDLLAAEFVEHQYDLKWLLRELSLSETYQRSSITKGDTAAIRTAMSEYRVFGEKPISAEQLMWSLLTATNMTAAYPQESADPDQDNPLPTTLDAVRTQFLEAFANPPREPEGSFAPSIRGALFLLNSELVLHWVTMQPGNLASELNALESASAIADKLYITILSRRPSAGETDHITAYLDKSTDKPQAVSQIIWALLASNEFMINH
ncbi:MAG: DUF1549 domain-containing protein [Planctomycetota bacterium]|nr:DUF1549 domain-containing protein [Planctomycetota bacterium]